MTLETSGTISDSQTKGAISLMDLKFPFFQLENQSSWEWTDQTTATTSQGISASYSKIRRTDKHVRPEETAESFSSTLYLLTAEKSNTLRDQYYPKLLERKITLRHRYLSLHGKQRQTLRIGVGHQQHHLCTR